MLLPCEIVPTVNLCLNKMLVKITSWFLSIICPLETKHTDIDKCFSNFSCTSDSPRGLVKTQMPGPHPKRFDSAGLG